MIKKITFICLFALTASNTQIKPVDLQQTAIGTAAVALVTKIISEAVAIEQLNKTTAKAVGIQASADAASNVATIAGLTVPLQLFFDNISKAKPTRSHSEKDFEKVKFRHKCIMSFVLLLNSLGTLKLEEAVKHLAQNKAMYKNKKAIANYRKDPQVHEFLTKEKSKQRRWISANYLLTAITAVAIGLGIAKADLPADQEKLILVPAIGFTLLAGYISEQFRAAKFNKLANATSDNPLDIPDQEGDADQVQTEQTTSLIKAS